MKNFTKKRGFFAVAAALLAVTAMFVTTWCSNNIGSTDDFTPPEGKGAVKLSFNDEIARTILPEDANGINDFDEFELQFAVNAGGTAKTVSNLTLSTLYNPIVLDPGIYDLTVVAFIEDGSNVMQPAATNAAPVTVTIEAGKIKNASIELKVIAPASGKTGTFSYKLNGISTFDSEDTANMTLTPIGGVGTSHGPVNIKGQFDNNARTITIDTGIYYVDFILKVAGETVTFRHIAHIYQNMTSSYTFTVSLNYFNAVFQLEDGNITFEIEDCKPKITYTKDGGASTIYAGAFNVTRGQQLVFTVSNASDFTAGVYEWFCVSTTSLSSTNTCTINTGSGTYSIAKNYTLTVIGVSEEDNQKYSTNIEFTVTP